MHIWDTSDKGLNSNYTFMKFSKKEFSNLQTYLVGKGCPVILPDREDLRIKVYDKFEKERLAKGLIEPLATLRYAGCIDVYRSIYSINNHDVQN